jgi:uncharacterized protein (DUF2062 family)
MKEATLTRNWVVEGFNTLGKYCLSAIKAGALMTGGIGGLVIVGIWLLLLVFPIFLFVSVILKILG